MGHDPWVCTWYYVSEQSFGFFAAYSSHYDCFWRILCFETQVGILSIFHNILRTLFGLLALSASYSYHTHLTNPNTPSALPLTIPAAFRAATHARKLISHCSSTTVTQLSKFRTSLQWLRHSIELSRSVSTRFETTMSLQSASWTTFPVFQDRRISIEFGKHKKPSWKRPWVDHETYQLQSYCKRYLNAWTSY